MLRLLGALLLLATLAGSVLYFQSDVFRTKANREIKNWTEWTPENITKDPKGYLTFAITELDKIGVQLKAHKLALDVEFTKAEGTLKAETRALEVRSNVLDQLRDAYRTGNQMYPVSLGTEKVAETVFQNRVIQADREVEARRETTERYTRYLDHLKGELARTETEMKNLVEKRQYVQQRLQETTLNQAVGASSDLVSKADEIAATAKALRAEANKSTQEVHLIRAEEKKLEGQSVKDRFEQIMGSK